ncbi:MAG: DUF4347 domain-containing protein, partial [Simplicispira sp.]|nr:DUF4347 domain-containing protein [Simplicispira sp.]
MFISNNIKGRVNRVPKNAKNRKKKLIMQIIQFSPEYAFGHAQELIVADGSALEIVTLLQGAAAPTLLLADRCHALQAITTALAGENLHTLHLVAHGQAGGFSMGGQWIDAAALRENTHLLVQWKVQRIALWSCEQGQSTALLETLARLTGAQVFASPKALGLHTETQERHWELLCADHPAATPVAVPFQAAVVQSWNHQLVTLRITGLYQATVSGASDTFFGEETNSVTISTTPFTTTNVTFSQSGMQFSGNNVLGTVSYTDGSGNTQSFAGLASRPIKVGGVIKGFYVWVDAAPTGGSAADTAFILSLDNSYFSANSKIGSSSDRVDSALNSLLPLNSAPVGVNDSATFLEDSTAQTGNVLTNDTDSNGDSLAVSSFSIAGVSGTFTLGTAKTIP